MIDDRGRHEGQLLQTAAARMARTDEVLAAVLADRTPDVPVATAIEPSSRTSRFTRRRPRLNIVAAAAVIALFIGGLVVVSLHDHRRVGPVSIPDTAAAAAAPTVTTSLTNTVVAIDDLARLLPLLPVDGDSLKIGIADGTNLHLTDNDPNDAAAGPCIVVDDAAPDTPHPCAPSTGGRGLVYGTWTVATGTLLAVAVNGHVTVNAIGCDLTTGTSGTRIRLSACIVPIRRTSIELRFDTDGGSYTATVDTPAPPVVAQTSTTATIQPTTTTTPVPTLGPVNFTLPSDAAPFPRAKPALPDWVVAYDRWSITDHGTLTIAVQSQHPLFPDWELIEEFDANGLHWQVYDTGPEDGSTTSVYAPLDDTRAVLVGGQAWNDSNELIRDHAIDLAKSIVRND